MPINKTINKTTYTLLPWWRKFCSHSTDPGDINAALGHLRAPSLSMEGQTVVFQRPQRNLRGWLPLAIHIEKREEKGRYIFSISHPEVWGEAGLGARAGP